MKFSKAALAGGLTAALVAVPMSPAMAGTASAGGNGWTASVSVPDATWSQHGCEEFPVQIATSGVPEGRWVVDMSVRLRGSGTTTDWIYAYGHDTPTGTDSIQLCSWHPSGTYDVNGTIEVGYDGVTAPLATSFTVSPMPSATALTSAELDRDGLVTISGRAIATSATLGTIGANSDGNISMQAFVNGNWTEFDNTYPDQLGGFSSWSYPGIPAGTQIRAVYQGANTTAPSTSAPLTLAGPPAPNATVKVKAIGNKSKLRVDVNPNRGKGFWTFQVQKQQADGSWMPLKTYKTLGAKETRTVNLPKGTYRVVVKAKYGYRETASDPVMLKR